MGSKGSQTTTTDTAAQPYYQNQYQNLAGRALDLSLQSYQPYTGQLTAPINQQQQTAISNVNDLYPQVSGMISGAAQPLTAAQIQQYYNPYQQNVINATEAQFANTNAQQFNQADANAVMAGAYGGTGNVRAKAMLTNQQQLAEAPVIAGLEQQGWQSSVGLAGQQFQQNPEQAAGLLASTGTNIANTQFGYGTAEQQTQQNALNAAYQQWLQQQAYPFQTTAFAAGEVGGLGSLAGGTGQVTAPAPSLIAQYGGLGIAGLGAYGAYQNAQARGGRVLRRQGGLVPHFASGGGPGNMPYVGGISYIPTEPLPHGAGPPHPVSTSIPNNSNQILQQATKLAGTFGRSGSRDAADDASEDAVYNSSDATFGRAYGGLVLPQRNRIEFKRGGPIRAGLGFSSFVPRRGYQYGGSPEELAASGVPATFDERFPTQSGLAPADFDARFQGQAPDLDGGTIMQPGLEPPAVVSPPASAPQATPVQTARVEQEDAPDVVTKGPEAVSRGRATWEAKARRAAEAEGIDPNVFAGIIHQESGFNPNVRPSSAGAIGIAQFMPKTAADMGVDPRNPETSLPAAARYFKQLLKDFNGDYPKAIAAYNAGPGRVASGAPLPAETQAYVPAVMAFAGQGAQGAGTAAGLATDEDGYTTLPPPRGRTSGLATGQERPSGGKGPFGMNSDVSMALMAAGLGMAASRSPFPGVAIGEGGLAGLGAYGSLQRQHLAEQQLERQNAREFEQERHARATERVQQQNYERQLNAPKVLTPGQQLVHPQTGKVIAGNETGSMNDAAVDFTVDRLRAGDKSALQNLGRGAQSGQNLVRIQNRMAERAAAERWSGAQMAAAQANFTSQAAAAKTAAVRSANVETAIEEANQTFPLAIEASANLPRTSFVPLNKLEQMVREGTSSPEQIKYNTAIRGAITAYAQAMSRTGTNSVHAQQAAEELINRATGHEGIVAAFEQMGKEMEAAKVAPEIVRKHILERIGGGKGPPGTTETKATTAPTPAATAKPKPTDADISYAKAHPEVRQKFIDQFGVNP